MYPRCVGVRKCCIVAYQNVDTAMRKGTLCRITELINTMIRE